MKFTVNSIYLALKEEALIDFMKPRCCQQTSPLLDLK